MDDFLEQKLQGLSPPSSVEFVILVEFSMIVGENLGSFSHKNSVFAHNNNNVALRAVALQPNLEGWHARHQVGGWVAFTKYG
jgi:hypothetical protein